MFIGMLIRHQWCLDRADASFAMSCGGWCVGVREVRRENIKVEAMILRFCRILTSENVFPAGQK